MICLPFLLLKWLKLSFCKPKAWPILGCVEHAEKFHQPCMNFLLSWNVFVFSFLFYEQKCTNILPFKQKCWIAPSGDFTLMEGTSICSSQNIYIFPVTHPCTTSIPSKSLLERLENYPEQEVIYWTVKWGKGGTEHFKWLRINVSKLKCWREKGHETGGIWTSCA